MKIYFLFLSLMVPFANSFLKTTSLRAINNFCRIMKMKASTFSVPINVLVPIADGSEEIESVTVVRILLLHLL